MWLHQRLYGDGGGGDDANADDDADDNTEQSLGPL